LLALLAVLWDCEVERPPADTPRWQRRVLRVARREHMRSGIAFVTHVLGG
jgi:hypothetical protein